MATNTMNWVQGQHKAQTACGIWEMLCLLRWRGGGVHPAGDSTKVKQMSWLNVHKNVHVQSQTDSLHNFYEMFTICT
jgi:hypothetical protein